MVVMRTNCEVLVAWRIAYRLAPLLGLLERSKLFLEVIEIADRDFAHVACDRDVPKLLTESNRAGLLIGWIGTL
jgi:hypothetical protein